MSTQISEGQDALFRGGGAGTSGGAGAGTSGGRRADTLWGSGFGAVTCFTEGCCASPCWTGLIATARTAGTKWYKTGLASFPSFLWEWWWSRV